MFYNLYLRIIYLCIYWIIMCLIFNDARCKHENQSFDLRDFSLNLSTTQLEEKHQRKLNLF